MRRLAAGQADVVTVGQLVRAGADHAWIARQLRGGHWQRLHHGVIVVHSGPVGWGSRAWAALLHAGPGAALSHTTAAHVLRIRAVADDRPIEVSIPERRRVAAVAGVVVHRRRTMPPLTPGTPTVVGLHTVVDAASRARSTDDVIGWVTDGVRAGVPVEGLRQVLAGRQRLRHGALLRELLEEARRGVESPLELRFVRDVERRHRLPRSRAQVPDVIDGIGMRADRWYEGLGVRVELDGVTGHPGGRTDRDTWRDNAVLVVRGEITLRYRWRHVAVGPCATAAQVAAALRGRGWAGRPRRCSPACVIS